VFSKGEETRSTLPPWIDVVINAHCPASRETKYKRGPSVTMRLSGATRPVWVNCVILMTRGSAKGQSRQRIGAATPAKKSVALISEAGSRRGEAAGEGTRGSSAMTPIEGVPAVSASGEGSELSLVLLTGNSSRFLTTCTGAIKR